VLIRIILLLSVIASLPLLAAEQKGGKRSGEEVYRVYCGSCHGGGWQQAPVAYDEREWKERMEKGFDVMLANAKKGVNGMPPMGTCMDCSDAELSDAIKEMLRF
jgi:cytochrome c5